LSGKARIEAVKTAGLVGDFTVSVYDERRQTINVEYAVDEQMAIKPFLPDLGDTEELFPGYVTDSRTRPNDDGPLLEYIRSLSVDPFFLADDRVIYNDELLEDLYRHDPLQARPVKREMPTPEKSRGRIALDVDVGMRRVADMLAVMTLGGQTTGSAGANSIYLEVLTRLAKSPKSVGESSVDLRRQIRDVGLQSERFEKFGLVPPFASRELSSTVSRLPGDRRSIAEEILLPYLNSLRARLDALHGAQSLIETFTEQANGFLAGKTISYRPGTGFEIVTDDGIVLSASMLSSGERQLVLLLCNTLLASRSSRLFIIDEPEISLNAKWQRKLIRALLACTRGSGVQFVVATHSIEILSAHRETLARLEPVTRD